MTNPFIYSDGINFKLNYSEGFFKVKYNKYMSGLLGTRYVGYHNDDPLWFDGAYTFGDTINLTSIDNFSSSPDFAQEDNYSWQWIGYFKPSSTEIYRFYTSSDDGSYLWIGENALSGYNTANALVNNGGPHGNQEVFGSINLTANIYYPIRIQFGEIGGGDLITVSFSTDTIPKTTDGNNYYFHGV